MEQVIQCIPRDSPNQSAALRGGVGEGTSCSLYDLFVYHTYSKASTIGELISSFSIAPYQTIKVDKIPSAMFPTTMLNLKIKKWEIINEVYI